MIQSPPHPFRRSASRSPSAFGRTLVLTSWLLSAVTAGGRAWARAGGIEASGCTGCHNGGPSGTLALTATPSTLNPGDRIELTLSIMGGYSDGGVYVTTGGVGDLQAIASQGLTKTSSGGLVHNQPKPASGGAVQFRFAWVAPSSPGAVRFSVSALGGNGNNRTSGDAGLDGSFDFVYGCSGKTFYMDGDGDGVGRDDFTMTACVDAPPKGFVEAKGDCDDYRKAVYPGATELCNLLDDNCDGQVDENAVPVELWPDADGDGYYNERTEKMGMPKIGCAGLKGFAAEPGDCQPMNKAVHPAVQEICNSIDDDCDGDVDERVRPTCGEGWCRREAPGCDVALCRPGEPSPEKCNFLDDDCDGAVDNGPNLCPEGQTCAAGACVDSSTVVLDPSGTPMSSAGSSGSGSTPSPPSSNGGRAMSSATPDSDSSGCALGARTSHGALLVLALLTSTIARRRRRP